MAVKMRKWSPWPPARKFAVAVRLMRLEVMAEVGGGDEDGGSDAAAQKFVAIKIKWKGEPKLFPLMPPFQPRKKVEQSSNRAMKKSCGIVEWDEDLWFENTCCFSIVSDSSDKKFGPWEIAFNVITGEKVDSKAKMAVIGGVSVNISEIVWKMESSSIEEKLHLNLQIDGIAREAALTVLFNCVEIRESQDSAAAIRSKSIDVKYASAKYLSADGSKEKSARRSLSLEEVCLDESGAAESRALEPDKKDRWFSWKRRRFSLKRAKIKEEKLESKIENCDNETKIQSAGGVSPADSFNDSLQKDDGSSETAHKDKAVCLWEDKELMSRDGRAKLKAPFFFASFDQRSDKAAGASACTALVAVISHWLHSNADAMPGRSELDDLIMQGSSEWRKLCEDAAYVKDFPNKHFDLETVLRADIRPVSISHNESFVGFFGAERFDSLKGAMSFDDIWDEIRSGTGDSDVTVPRIYIVSWNDHFFVLKVEANAYYIIDTLGERLYEGCNQAYMIRFDDKAVIQAQKPETETAESEHSTDKIEVICSGKECCREFIKRFLAAIPLKELEEEEKKSAVSYFCLHQRLQIEFNYSCLISPASSSSTSSPLSSLTTSASSPSSD